MSAALLLLAFTAGAVLSPVMGAALRLIVQGLHHRKVERAKRVVLAAGYGLIGKDDTQPLAADVSQPESPHMGFGLTGGDWL